MWGEEKRKKKIEKSLSIGVAVLVLLMLAIQFSVFIRQLIVGQRTVPVLSVQADSLSHPKADESVRNGLRAEGKPYGSANGDIRPTVGSTGNSAGRAAGTVEGRTSSGSRLQDGKEAKDSGGEAIIQNGATDGFAVCRGGSSDAGKHRKYDYDGWKWDRVELNSADSAALEALPWIGPYYAQQIIRYRTKLWGSYADVSQLMDIRGIDSVLLEKLGDRIYIDQSTVLKLDLYSLPEDSLAMHPYIGAYRAKGICRYRKLVTEEEFSIRDLVENKILPESCARRLKLYVR